MNALDTSSLPARVRLTGSDCFHLVLDRHARKHNSGSNVMRIVFYFDKHINAYSVEQVLHRSPLIHWLCNITLVPGSLFTTPYWKYENRKRQALITEHHHDKTNDIPEIVMKRDIPINAERFIDCDIIQYASHSAMVLSWNHIVMDGRGIGMLLQHLNEIADGLPVHPNNVLFPAAEKKTGFVAYVRNMYKVKSFIQASSKSPIASVAEKRSTSAEHFDNRLLFFSKEETEKIHNNAFKNGARFGPNLFYLSCCAHTVNQVNTKRGKQGTMWMPIPYDGRLRGAFGPVISNAVAYLFYRVPQSEMGTVKQTVKCMSDQMTDQMKQGMPQRYGMLLNMLRHIPLWLYYFLINRTGEGTFASFLYSSTGEYFNKIDHLFGEKVQHLTIYPSPTFPPGLTFSFLKHGDALNINIAYSSDIISNIELETIENKLRNLLLADT